jgi:hypothetical protein
MAIKDFDIVEVINDIPEKGVRAGMRGAVIDIHHEPCLAYEVEFSDESGQTIMEAALLSEQIRKLGSD